MVHLILTVIAIGLSAALIGASINYLNPTWPLIDRVATQVKSGVLSLEQGINQYAVVNADVNVGLPTFPSVDTWEADVTPSYTFLPKPPPNLTYTYGESTAQPTYLGPGHYVCLSGAASEIQYKALVRAGREMSPQQYVLSDTCGATAAGTPPVTWPATVAATYWLTPIIGN